MVLTALKLSIPKAEYQQRLNRTRQRLRDSGLDALLAVSGYGERDGNVCYLCGHKNAFPYCGRSDIISGLGYSAFLVPLEGPTTLISPLGYRSDLVVGVDKVKTGTNFGGDLISAITESGLDSHKLALVGSDIIPVTYISELNRAFPTLSLKYADELVTDQRKIKSETELKLLRQASRVADKAVQIAIDSIKPGMTESAIGSVARKAAMEAGADYVVRDRVQSGSEVGTLRWPFASQKKVRKGELVEIDFVGWVNAYGFDILRMSCVGRPNKEQRVFIETAGEATKAMTDALTDGAQIEASVAQLKNFERDGIRVEPFGHAIGLEVGENPWLLPGVTGTVKKNMVFCVEPELKSAKSWASIENEVIVTDSKPEVLTKLPVNFWG
jgi:Xaa-Pro aminopeptidase